METSSKIVILSYDSYFRNGLQTVTDSICLSGINCTGNILIIDLLGINSGYDPQVEDFCHVIYIVSEPAILPFISEVEFKYDAYFLIRNAAVEYFRQTITNLVISIMQKKCYWTGVKKTKVSDGFFIEVN